MEWCTRKPQSSSIILYSSNNIAHNHHSNNNPTSTLNISTSIPKKSINQLTQVRVHHNDKRSWLLDFEDFKKAQRFEFAVHETQEALKKEGGSMFMDSASLKKDKNKDFGHNQMVY